jgi:hypothetical protein
MRKQRNQYNPETNNISGPDIQQHEEGKDYNYSRVGERA